MKRNFLATIVFVCLALFVSCTSYERQVVPLKTPESIPNAVSLDGAIIAARAFANAVEIHAGLYQQMFDNMAKVKDSFNYYVCPVCGIKGKMFKKIK